MKTADEVVKLVHSLMNDKNNYTAKIQAKAIVEEYAKARAGQVDAIVNALTSRKQHWMIESRRLAIEEPDSDEAEDATHMYGVYIDAVDDMKTHLKEGH